jgi:hypothetical protein
MMESVAPEIDRGAGYLLSTIIAVPKRTDILTHLNCGSIIIIKNDINQYGNRQVSSLLEI